MLAALAAEIHGDEREAWHDICDEGYIHEFQHQFYEQFKYINSKSSRSTEFQDVLPLNISQVITKWISRCLPTEHLSSDHELNFKMSSHWISLRWSRRPFQSEREESYALCAETGHPVFSLLESQWKLRQKHDWNFPMEGKLL